MRSLVLIGSGLQSGYTGQAPEITAVMEQCAAQIRASDLFGDVVVGYWQGEPSLRQVLRCARSTSVTVLPVGMLAGELTETIIPRELGLGHQGPVPREGVARVLGGRTVRYLPPVASLSHLPELVIKRAELARQEAPAGDLDPLAQASWQRLSDLTQRIFRMGELLITPSAGLLDVRHALDEGRSVAELRTFVTLGGLRDVLQDNASGLPRSVHTFRDLPRGWRAVVSADDLRQTLHLIYPAMTEESHAFSLGRLRPTPWRTTARRQTGAFAAAMHATPAQVAQVSVRVCGGCLRRRLWAGESMEQTVLEGVPGGIPCAEACTYLISAVCDAVETALPTGLPSIPFSRLDERVSK